jgi:hypothetical protein
VIADEEEDVCSLIDSFFPPGAITEMFVQDSSVEWVKKRIVEVEAGLVVLKTQVNHPRDAKLFLNSMRAQNIGKDIAAMATDVRRSTETGTVRSTTWAQKGNKASAKFTRNTMGLHIP